MNNTQIAGVFEDIAFLLEMAGEKVFQIRAYQRAARTISHLPTELDQMLREEQDLTEIPGIGKAISDKIGELIDTGELAYLQNLKTRFPDLSLDLLKVPGLGPKTVARLYGELGISDLDGLREGIESGAVAALPRMGKKSTDNILRQIEAARTKDQRTPVGRAMRAADRLISALREECPSLTRIEAAGSLRRFEETIGDIDLVCTAGDHAEVLAALVGQPNVREVLGHGGTKASVVLSEGIQVDLRVVKEGHYGALLQYFTGSLQHNVELRSRAQRMGLSLNEYGLTNTATGEVEEFAAEEELYERLEMDTPPPELRQGMYEVQAAAERALPRLVTVEDVKGDLHDHTDWSDGRDPLELMLAAAAGRGLDYVAITDHSVGRGIANGLSVERLKMQAASLKEIRERFNGMRVLHGTEMDIRADGSLDYDDDVLEELDWVIGSIHSGMGQDAETMTRRIIKAMHNPHVTVIGHLSTRLIGQRPPIEADYDAILRAAAETGTAMEINASPERLDLKDTLVYRARELGVPLVISTDAHTTEALDNTRFGVAVARRGWCEARHILNALPLEGFLEYLATAKPQRTEWFARNA